uniref:hypothetical protein n=1 Tax=uncultured Caulobacter sp. TaxID=158749 RepID=UPI0025FA437D|nr:hypothetical protein [uncultured Caulobacter sp.]
MTREELDAKLEALEARSDAKFERMFAHLQTSHADLRSELRAELQTSFSELSAKIDALAARSVDKVTAVGMLIGAIALIFSMIAFGGDQFGAGREVGVAIAALDAKIDRLQANPSSSAVTPAPTTAPKAVDARK